MRIGTSLTHLAVEDVRETEAYPSRHRTIQTDDSVESCPQPKVLIFRLSLIVSVEFARYRGTG